MRPPALTHDSAAIFLGDCLDVLAEMPDNSVDAIVTDPPYGLGFMGKAWDDLPPGLDWARECLRVLKPGGHLLAFGGSRTWHRLAVAIEDAGFEMRDSIAWLYGSGFPKSMDVSKAIDKVRSEDRAPVDAVRLWLNARRLAAGYSHDAVNKYFGHASNGGGSSSAWMTNPTSRSLPTWDQWLALKELFGFSDEMDAEVWRLNGRKGTPGEAWQTAEVIGTEDRYNEPSGIVNAGQGERVAVTRQIKAPATPAAQQWSGWGTALKPAFEPIVVARKPLIGTVAANVLEHGTGALNIDACRVSASGRPLRESKSEVSVSTFGDGLNGSRHAGATDQGRWPTNVVLDGDAADELDEQSGTLKSGSRSGKRNRPKFGDQYGVFAGSDEAPTVGDSGGASRFFPTFRYQAKAPTRERPVIVHDDGTKTAHPTVKPLALMRWLVRLVTPAGGTVLDTFAGSGATGEAAIEEGFYFLGIEREADYIPLIQVRFDRVTAKETP